MIIRNDRIKVADNDWALQGVLELAKQIPDHDERKQYLLSIRLPDPDGVLCPLFFEAVEAQ